MSPFQALRPDQPLQEWVDQRMALIPYSRMAGMAATAVEPGRVTLGLPARPEWSGDSLRNRVHTGCLVALADTACGFAVATAAREGGVFATLDLRMDYLRSADVGADLVCQAHCHRMSRSVGFVSGELRQAGSDEVIALVNATFMRAASGAGPRKAATGEAGAGPGGSRPAAEPPAAAEAAPDRPALPEGRSPYVDFLGVVKHARSQAGPIFRLPFRPDLIGNPKLPAVHGGVLAGFAETAMILHLVAANPAKGLGIPKAIDFAIDYLRPARPVDTFAQSTTIRLGNRVSLVQASLYQDDPGRPVAATRGHWLMPLA